ncbi:peptide MFS transporter [Tunicatimonas pelagia]|uniref:peptide MFS transporter n=1 Tax=Tunicatimonas pelagia TaxID=931531 RepID=UPI002666E164|nr:oligopeptide:H+ symporter [Tunicatimonas pelagia]WKN43639.1 oligopeptide:H+ symporter [Tunicatimonas pelagia]
MADTASETNPLTATQETSPPEVFGHPKGLFYLFFAELWERFSFYGMRALLTLYMVEQVFEALSNRDTISAIVYSSYGSLVYASPLIGGKIADELLGYRKSIMLGGIFMAVGHFVLAIENNVAFFLALAFIIVGNGFFKPNISTFVGALYPPGDTRKDSGFTIFHMGINIGAFLSPILCGWLGAAYGWHYGFGLAGVGMLVGVIVFQQGINKGVFMNHGLPPEPKKLEQQKFGLKLESFVWVLSLLAVPVIALLLASYQYIAGGESFLGKTTVVNLIFYGLSIFILGYLAYIMSRIEAKARKQLAVAILLTVFMTLFWGFHELSGNILTLFSARNVTLNVWPFNNAAATNALNPLFIILFAIPVSALWVWLSKKRINPRTPYKFAMGIAFLGLGYYILFLSGGSANEQGMVPFIFLVLLYLCMSLGELFTYPVGLSKITDLSPQIIVAFMMGVWFLSNAYAFQVVGFVGQRLAIDDLASGEEASPLETLQIYTAGFESIAYVCFGGAIVVLLLSPLLNRWMAEVH